MLEHLLPVDQQPNRVVVIGANGFVGTALVRLLEYKAIPVLRVTRADVDLLAAGAADRLADLLRDGDSAVAVSAMAPCKNPEMLGDNIVLATALTRGLAKRSLAHVINVSSDAVYCDSATPMTEDSVKDPSSYHGIMHLSREIMFTTEIKAPLAMLRPTLIYGLDDPHNGYGPNQFRRKAERGEKITLFGEGEERRDHILVDDVAELLLRMLLRKSVGGLNAATGKVWSFREIASMVVNLHPNPVQIVGSVRNGPMPHNGYRAFDVSAITAAFPDFRLTQLPEGLARIHSQART